MMKMSVFFLIVTKQNLPWDPHFCQLLPRAPRGVEERGDTDIHPGVIFTSSSHWRLISLLPKMELKNAAAKHGMYLMSIQKEKVGFFSLSFMIPKGNRAASRKKSRGTNLATQT